MAGYIHISRKLFNHWLWEQKREFSQAEAWIDLINMAAYKEHSRVIAGAMVKIERGEVVASERYLEQRWGWGRKRVRGFLGRLEKDRMAVTISHHEGNHITICNYEEYNGDGTSKDTMGYTSKDTTEEPNRIKEIQETKESVVADKSAPAAAAKNSRAKKAPQILCDIPLILDAIPGFKEAFLEYLTRNANLKRAIDTVRAQELELGRLMKNPDGAMELLEAAILDGLKISWVLERRQNATGKTASYPKRGQLSTGDYSL